MDRVNWDANAFKLWLEQQPAGSMVGRTAVPCDCPLAQWQKSLNNTVEIQFNYVVGLRGQDRIAIPLWATHFTYECDAINCSSQEPISREQALEALRIVLES